VHYAALREEAHKSWQHSVSDEIVYLPESIPILNQAIGVEDRIALPEIYRNGDAWIELQFVLVGDRNANYVALIERFNGDKFSDGLGEMGEDFASISGNPPVLVEVTHSVEPPERMRFTGFSSVVWLKRFDLCDGLVGDIPHLALPSFNISEGFGRVVEDRELSSIGGEFRNLDRQARQTENQLIQGRAHAVQRISHDQRRRIRNIMMPKAKDVPLICKIIVTLKGIRLSFVDELPEFDIESLKVHLRPTNFQIGIDYSGHGYPPEAGG
jgi:hypothetical protein